MSATWPHWLRLFAPAAGVAGGVSNADGIWTDDITQDTEEPIYEGPADVQDGGRMFDQSAQGQEAVQSDAVAFLKDASNINTFANRTGMRAEITWEDKTTDLADVIKVRRLDGTIWMKRL